MPTRASKGDGKVRTLLARQNKDKCIPSDSVKPRKMGCDQNTWQAWHIIDLSATWLGVHHDCDKLDSRDEVKRGMKQGHSMPS
jgi:hypothetical protein